MIPSSFLARRCLAFALGTALVSLAGCGGFTAVDVGGTITNLIGTGLKLANGDSTVSPAPGATSFVFPAQVEIRAPYAITVVQQPTRQRCDVVNGAGFAGAAPVTIVAVNCTTNTYTLGGTVTGLKGTNLVLTNGSDRVTVAAGDVNGNASFTFPTQVADGAAYGVEVLQQPSPPPAQSCSVVNGTGTGVMGSAAVTGIQVACK